MDAASSGLAAVRAPHGRGELIGYDGSCLDCGEAPFRRLGMIWVARLAESLAVVLAVVAVLVVAFAPFGAPDYGPTTPR